MSGKQNKPKKQKNVRNKGRDFIMDYYKTNRAITKEYDKAYKEQKESDKATGRKRAWTRTEKAYVIIIALGLVGIAIRFLIL